MSAAIYTRQSIEKKDSESIDVQIEYAKNILSRMRILRYFPIRDTPAKT